jgi:hypothetical protein
LEEEVVEVQTLLVGAELELYCTTVAISLAQEPTHFMLGMVEQKNKVLQLEILG